VVQTTADGEHVVARQHLVVDRAEAIRRLRARVDELESGG
jgi:hypothetical protein